MRFFITLSFLIIFHKTVNFDKGTQTGPKGERVELDPETLTLLNEAGEEVTSVTTPQGKYELDKDNKTIIQCHIVSALFHRIVVNRTMIKP